MAKLKVNPAIIRSENTTRSWTFFQKAFGCDAVFSGSAPAVLIAALARDDMAGVRCRRELVFGFCAESGVKFDATCDALADSSWLLDVLLFALVFERVIMGDKFLKFFSSSSEVKCSAPSASKLFADLEGVRSGVPDLVGMTSTE